MKMLLKIKAKLNLIHKCLSVEDKKILKTKTTGRTNAPDCVLTVSTWVIPYLRECIFSIRSNVHYNGGL